MERTVFNKAQLEMLDIMANIRSDEELDALKHAVSEFYAETCRIRVLCPPGR